MSEQPEALRLADALEAWTLGKPTYHCKAAAELRRLHAVNIELLRERGAVMTEADEGLFDDVPLANRERDKAFEAFIKRKDVKSMFSDGFPFPVNRGYYDFWCIVWAKAWDKGFKIGWEERGKNDKG